MPHHFSLLQDRQRFPLVTGGAEQVVMNLLGCPDLTFVGLKETALASVFANKPGRPEWHLYGDVRWPWPTIWVELTLPSVLSSRRAGVIVALSAIPTDEPDKIAWVSENHPLAPIRMEMRDPSLFEDIWNQVELDPTDELPEDKEPAFAQGYCIFVEDAAGAKFVACYTDLLNSAGIPIPAFRISTATDFLAIKQCQFVLHSLFQQNEARLNGKEFVAYHQLPEVAALPLGEGTIPPQWTRFHPTRTLRARPALRATPAPPMKNGCFWVSDYEMLLDVRRRELNLHNLAFAREARARDMVRLNNDGNISMTAYVHRAEGGAIFVLPDELVEEFYNTDCDEVRLADLQFPFKSLYLSFTPPEPLKLSEGFVDGCYVCLQQDEVLFVLTTRLAGVNYVDSLSVTSLDPTMSLHLPVKDLEMPLNKAVEAGILDFLEKNAPPEEDRTETVTMPNGHSTTIVDVRAKSRRRRIEEFRSQEGAFRACLNIVVNGLCFIEFRPDDVREEWAGEPSRELLETSMLPPTSRRAVDKAAGAQRRLAEGDYTRVRVCGRSLFDAFSSPSPPPDGAGHRPRSHWRRGHWRRQRHGVGLELIGLRWIRPTLVNRNVGTPAEARIYSI